MEKKVAGILAESFCDKLADAIDGEDCVRMCKEQEINAIQVLEKLEDTSCKIGNYLEVIGPLCRPFDVTSECREIDKIFQDVQLGINYLESRFAVLKDF